MARIIPGEVAMLDQPILVVPAVVFNAFVLAHDVVFFRKSDYQPVGSS